MVKSNLNNGRRFVDVENLFNFLRLSKDQKSRFGLDVWWPSRSGGCKVEVVVVIALIWC